MKYVFYHANCNDGFAAALCAWKKFGKFAKYVPIQYYREAEAVEVSKLGTDHSDVYFLDFCPPKEMIHELAGYHSPAQICR
mgnify:CR=1 FL=1